MRPNAADRWRRLPAAPSLDGVTVLHLVLIVLGLLALASMPCWVALLSGADDLVERAGRAVRRAVRRRLRRRRLWPGRSLRERRRLARLDRNLDKGGRALPEEPSLPPIQQVAADLRRLSRQRIGLARSSTVWFAAVQRAYDDRLRVACEELRLAQHLDGLTGIDLEIERVRVEGELQAAGMDLRLGLEPSQDQR
jgi:hypothetical protein